MFDAMSGPELIILWSYLALGLPILFLIALYWVIRNAVRGGIEDAERRKQRQAV